ncbi:MAG: HDIG domain-containing protein [Methanomicrobiaceae archaeon]|nr:HDIG domain-containing protein [Methanomicrobiaceae archaeon]
MNREDAVALLHRYVSSDALRKHCSATAAVMKQIGAYLGEDADRWEVIGILHDIDYERVGEDMERHGPEGYRLLRENGVDEEIAEIVKRHNHMLYGPSYEAPVEISLQAADSVSGLVIACALVKGGAVTDVSPKTVKKKFKEKSFAAGCDRDRIALIDSLMDRQTLYELAIAGITSIRDELGLR